MYKGLQIERRITRLCLERELIGKKYPSKPSRMKLKWAFVVPALWLASSSNYLSDSPRNRVPIYLIRPATDVVTVLSIAVSKFLVVCYKILQSWFCMFLIRPMMGSNESLSWWYHTWSHIHLLPLCAGLVGDRYMLAIWRLTSLDSSGS